jgi:hypothetical protein
VEVHASVVTLAASDQSEALAAFIAITLKE